MPVLKNAKKKLRQDKIRTARNKKLKELFKKLVKEARAKKTAESVNKAFSGIDKATKHHILPKNRAARMKSSLSKIVAGKTTAAAPKKPAAKKTPKKVVKKVKKTTTKKK